jgi:acetylxylan esterase
LIIFDSDTTLYYNNYGQEILEWTNVLGVSQTPTTTSTNNPQTSYTRTTYGCAVIGYSAAGVGHTVPIHEAVDLAFFGITGANSGVPISGCPVTGTTTGTTTAVVTTTGGQTAIRTTVSPTTTANGAQQTHWGQVCFPLYEYDASLILGDLLVWGNWIFWTDYLRFSLHLHVL